MARSTLQITTLHNYQIEELINLKNTTDCKYTRLALTVITMKHQGYANAQIAKATGFSNPTICFHIKKWNEGGMSSVKERRGGQKLSKLEPDIISQLLDTVTHKSPTDSGHVVYYFCMP